MKTVLITPSHLPDLQRCELLLETADKHVSGMAGHCLIVDQSDMPSFAHLQSNHITLIAKEDLLPGWIKKSPWPRKWWLSTKTMPVRGWILQQVVKLLVAPNTSMPMLIVLPTLTWLSFVLLMLQLYGRAIDFAFSVKHGEEKCCKADATKIGMEWLHDIAMSLTHLTSQVLTSPSSTP